MIYKTIGDSMKVLVALCVGWKKNNNTALINLDRSPWSQDIKGTLKPANNELAIEVYCCQKLLAKPGGASHKKHSMIKSKNSHGKYCWNGGMNGH